MRGAVRKAGAMAMRWRCPLEGVTPRSPISVSVRAWRKTSFSTVEICARRARRRRRLGRVLCRCLRCD